MPRKRTTTWLNRKERKRRRHKRSTWGKSLYYMPIKYGTAPDMIESAVDDSFRSFISVQTPLATKE